MNQAVALPLIAASLVGCQRAADVSNNVASVAPPKHVPTPAEVAQRLVGQRLGAQNLGFSGAQTFTNRGATIVCGNYQVPGSPAQRFITVGEDDVFVEGEYSGDFGQAVAETCRNA